jgi:hypothetical protein
MRGGGVREHATGRTLPLVAATKALEWSASKDLHNVTNIKDKNEQEAIPA